MCTIVTPASALISPEIDDIVAPKITARTRPTNPAAVLRDDVRRCSWCRWHRFRHREPVRRRRGVRHRTTLA
jgi:hypothetical protein